MILQKPVIIRGLILEFCNGGDLSEYLASKKTLSEDTIRYFLLQLADAMKSLRILGIVHRDLKPQNILLSYDRALTNPLPSQITLKIADFGFARTLENGVMAATLCGSPMYMAPEVIMSLKYDEKADLWSIGTIVYQALTGKAPFTAHSPQALKNLYETNLVLIPKIPSSTSPELSDLLTRVLKRNPKERICFEDFFDHKFLQREQVPKHDLMHVDLPLPTYGSPPRAPSKPSSPMTVKTTVEQQPDCSKNILTCSLEDDYVIVTKHGQTTDNPVDLEKEKWGTLPKMVQSPNIPSSSNSSPPRPRCLALPSEAVPMSRKASQQRKSSETEQEDSYSTSASNSVPRSAPITMKRQESKPEIDIDLSSLSPPSVKFMIGTPPGGRRRSTSGSSFSETPPPNLWSVSPVTMSRTSAISAQTNSPLRRSGTSPPVLSSMLTRMAILSSPNLGENNNLAKAPIFSTRAMTLPEISEMENNHPYYTDNDHPITFFAPEIPEETLLGKEHNETLAKINFVLALSNCILSLAAQKSSPIISLVDSVMSNQPVLDHRMEQIVLLIRALQLLSSGLNLATKQIEEGHLKPSSNVKNVVATLYSKFKQTLSHCKQLNGDGIISRLKSPEFTADTILFQYAIQMCQIAARDELFERVDECAEKYQTAQILLHSLSQQINCPCDKEKVKEYKNAVERRLRVLQEKGYIYATDFS
ncbi:hypothetical protein WA026_010804 [Henosepilachna vigintioctopunctata]|uniref:Protein kinase domain-containing protein n=1 Tax=Henosepilachna vigintioctopunctata TaxID=420089 RepID=A0AAW1US07_9CUCU